MATNTENYKLKKPAQDDFYNVDDFNDNMDIIDAELKNKYDPDNKPTASDIGGIPELLSNSNDTKIKFLFGDHRRLTNHVDASVPNLPAESNYMHMYVSHNGTVDACLSMPTDYGYDVYYYTVYDKKWRKVADASNFLSLAGGTLSDTLIIRKTLASENSEVVLKNSTTNNHGAFIYEPNTKHVAIRNYQDDTKNVYLVMGHADEELKNLLTLYHANQINKGYSIFGEHNKRSGSYLGGGENSRTIQIGGIGNFLLIYCDEPHVTEYAFVTPVGSQFRSIIGTGVSGYSEALTFKDGVLSLGGKCNTNNATYYWQVL